MFKLNHRGDTLVEVMMALSILSMVLLVSFNVASAAFRLGGNARERSQASNLIQEQAEGLRNYRDSHKWAAASGTYVTIANHTNNFGTGTGDTFHMEKTTTPVQWDVRSGDYPNAPLAGSASLFTLSIKATNVSVPLTDRNKIRFDITASWASEGSGPQNKTTISTFLVNLDNLAPVGSTITGPPPPSTKITLTVNPVSVTAGAYVPIDLTWTTSSDVTACSARGAWSGSLDPRGGTVRRTGDAGTPGVITYTLDCTNSGGTGVNASQQVTVSAGGGSARLQGESMTGTCASGSYVVPDTGATGPSSNNAGRLCGLGDFARMPFDPGTTWSKVVIRLRRDSIDIPNISALISGTNSGGGGVTIPCTKSLKDQFNDFLTYTDLTCGTVVGGAVGTVQVQIQKTNSAASPVYIDYFEFQP